MILAIIKLILLLLYWIMLLEILSYLLKNLLVEAKHFGLIIINFYFEQFHPNSFILDFNYSLFMFLPNLINHSLNFHQGYFKMVVVVQEHILKYQGYHFHQYLVSLQFTIKEVFYFTFNIKLIWSLTIEEIIHYNSINAEGVFVSQPYQVNSFTNKQYLKYQLNGLFSINFIKYFKQIIFGLKHRFNFLPIVPF